MNKINGSRFCRHFICGNFFLHPIHCDWHSTNILKFNCTFVMIQLYLCHVYFEKAYRVRWCRWCPHTFAQQWRTFELLVSSLFKGSFHSTLRCQKNVNQDVRMRTLVREGVGCENGINELECVIECRNH